LDPFDPHHPSSDLTETLPSTLYAHSLSFTNPATPQLYTLSLHDALPISARTRKASTWASEVSSRRAPPTKSRFRKTSIPAKASRDRKSTRLNSSHGSISYAVFCLKKKIKEKMQQTMAEAQYVTHSMQIGA